MNPLLKNVTLPTDTEDAPTVGLFVMAKNSEVVIGRLLDNVLPHVAGVSLVLNDTEDATLSVVMGRMEAHRDKWIWVKLVTSTSHPQFYFDDAPSSYEEGEPLAGEVFRGPFTHGPLLCDWAGARNEGWLGKHPPCDYKLFLDADDVVADPEKILPLAKLLAQSRVDVAATRYVFGRGAGGVANSVSYRERLVRSTSDIRWEGATHEVLAGGLRRVLVEDALLVTDMKDNWGRGVRVPGRCFKVLYRQARMANWKVSPRHLAYLVQESPGMMPAEWVAEHLVPRYRTESTCVEEEAWVTCMLGEMWEAKHNFGRAALCYAASIERFPTSKAWFRICRSCFRDHDYRGCVDAYEAGARLVTSDNRPILDDGPVYVDSTKILAAQAYHELGRTHHRLKDVERARELACAAAAAFPTSRNVASLRDAICDNEAKGTT